MLKGQPIAVTGPDQIFGDTCGGLSGPKVYGIRRTRCGRLVVPGFENDAICCVVGDGKVCAVAGHHGLVLQVGPVIKQDRVDIRPIGIDLDGLDSAKEPICRA